MTRPKKRKDKPEPVVDTAPDEIAEEAAAELEAADQSRDSREKEWLAKEAAWAEREDQLMRAMAEAENRVRRVERDRDRAISFHKGDLVLPLLEVLDDFERALAHPPEKADEAFLEGLAMVAARFSELLAGYGLEPIDALGQPFDPELHEALMQLPATDGKKDVVIQEISKGYKLDGRVLRPSKVAVAG